MRTVIILTCTILGISMFVPAPGFSRQTDTLSQYDRQTAFAYYTDREILRQASRFDLPAPAYLRSLRILVSGHGTGEFQVRIMGNEGAFPAPLIGEDLLSTQTVHKRKPGPETIEIRIPDKVYLDRPQFFVVVEALPDGAFLVSDRTETEPFCSAEYDLWRKQAIQYRNGDWISGKYTYAVDVILEYGDADPPGLLIPLTTDALDTIRLSTNRSIAWGDVNGDRRVDLMAGGRVFLNDSEKPFSKSLQPGERGYTSAADMFLDADNDGDLDILSIGAEEGAYLLKNDGTGAFHQTQILERRILGVSGMAIGDIDGNGLLDAYIGRGADSDDRPLPDLVVMNHADRGWVIELVDSGNAQAVLGVQLVDIDKDGDLDVYRSAQVLQESGFLINDGKGRFQLADDYSPAASSGNGPSGRDVERYAGAIGDLSDRNNSRMPQVLQPGNLAPESIHHYERIENLTTVPYQGWTGGATWVDVNNDGFDDLLMTSSCACRYTTLYEGGKSGVLQEASFKYGLFRLPAGVDAVWTDFNNDGKQDLASMVDEGFVLFQNSGEYEGRGTTVSLEGANNPASIIGGAAIAHYGTTSIRRLIGSGRGALMQGATAVHFGAIDGRRPDSIEIFGLNGELMAKITQPEASILYAFDHSGKQPDETPLQVSAWPNPFADKISLSITVTRPGRVKVTLYSVDGTEIAVLLDQDLEQGAQTIDWMVGRRAAGLAAGVYIWKAEAEGSTLTGRILHVD